MAMRIMVRYVTLCLSRYRTLLMGSKPLGKVAMTAAERQRRRRARLRPKQRYDALTRAWDACGKAERSRFLRELRAVKLEAKRERRAQRERELAEKTVATWPEADRRRWFERFADRRRRAALT
jgi:hypothetical protein